MGEGCLRVDDTLNKCIVHLSGFFIVFYLLRALSVRTDQWLADQIISFPYILGYKTLNLSSYKNVFLQNEADLNFMHTLYELDNFLNAVNFDTSWLSCMR